MWFPAGSDRRRLEALVRDRNAAQKHAWRAEIILLSADGVGTNEIMRRTGKPRVDDRRVISGIVHVLKSGGRWIDALPEYGPSKTLYNRFVLQAEKLFFPPS